MHRITVTLDDPLMVALDAFMEGRGHDNRSEAIRDLVRSGLHELSPHPQRGDALCVGALVYVYDHETRHLPERLADMQHRRHDLSVATLHVHLDTANCLEVAVLRGREDEVAAVANGMTAERGVRYGRLVTIPVAEDASHSHQEE